MRRTVLLAILLACALVAQGAPWAASPGDAGAGCAVAAEDRPQGAGNSPAIAAIEEAEAPDLPGAPDHAAALSHPASDGLRRSPCRPRIARRPPSQDFFPHKTGPPRG